MLCIIKYNNCTFYKLEFRVFLLPVYYIINPIGGSRKSYFSAGKLIKFCKLKTKGGFLKSIDLLEIWKITSLNNSACLAFSSKRNSANFRVDSEK